jgi:hypothetical protein
MLRGKNTVKLCAIVAWLLLNAGSSAADYPRYPPAGSTYVPLDSWVYPALERLAALRFIQSDFRGMRPWTRIECARLIDEAGERIRELVGTDHALPNDVIEVHTALEREFAAELEWLGGARNRSLAVESLYARAFSLSGPVLNDSYHFGQTIANDFGRPFRRGTNVIAGGAIRATFGPWFAYGQAEYQHAPSAPPRSLAERNLIAAQDVVAVPPAVPFESVNRFQLLDSYAGINVKNWQVSYGRQSLWWGTSESGPLLLSNNAEPINMLRLNRVVPLRLPGFLKILGPVRADSFVGRVGGHPEAAGPWLQGQRISFKMTRSFEYAITHTAMFGGKGRPGGIDVFFKSLIGVGEKRLSLGQTGVDDDALFDQHISFDFQYRFGRMFTYYGEFEASDDPHPFNAPSRMAVNTGLYFPRLPGLRKMDLRLEGTYTDTPDTSHSSFKSTLHYWHFIYKSGHTNNGFILGNSVGRAGVSYQGWLRYWLSPKEQLGFHFKRTIVSTTFVPHGAHWTDYSVQYDKALRSGFFLRSALQVEHQRYAFYSMGYRSVVAARIELRYSPSRD